MATTVYKPTGCGKVILFKFDVKRIQKTLYVAFFFATSSLYAN